jgi:hypothetical protein
VAPGVPIATPLQRFSRRVGGLCPKAQATSLGVGGVFSAGDVFATAAAAATRFRQCPDGLQIVGLLCVPSLTALPSGRWRPAARGFPSRQASGSGRPVALHSWPSPLLRRYVPTRAVPMPCPFVSRRASQRALARSGPAWDSSLGVVIDRPSIDISAWCPLPAGGLAPRGGSEEQPLGAVPFGASPEGHRAS